MAKRFTKPSVNWAELEKIVTAKQKTKLMEFKSNYLMYLRRVETSPAEPPKIDWEHYKKLVPDPSIVDKFKGCYEQFKVPYPEDKLSAKIDEQWCALEPKIKEFIEAVNKDIEAAKKELNRIKALPKFEDMTMEMFRDVYPAEALDPVNKPSFWPHNPEEQPGYLTVEQKALKAEKLKKKLEKQKQKLEQAQKPEPEQKQKPKLEQKPKPEQKKPKKTK